MRLSPRFWLALLAVPLVGCVSPVENGAAGNCDDGTDNDGDGLVDCDDPGCSVAASCSDDDDSASGNQDDDDSAPDDDDDSAPDDDDDSAPDDDDATPSDVDGDGTMTALDCDDLNPHLNALDLDADGSSSCDGDCDDNDAAVGIPAAGSMEELLCAMEVPLALVVPASAGIPNSSPVMFDPRTSLGTIRPIDSPRMVLQSTADTSVLPSWPGPGPAPPMPTQEIATLEFAVEVPLWANSFSLHWYFLTMEYPEWVGDIYNTTFEVYSENPSYTGQVVFDQFGNVVSVNNALFDVTDPAQLAGTGFDANGGTGWVHTEAPCTAGSQLGISIRLARPLSAVWPSAVLLTHFRFDAGPGGGGSTPL